MLVAILLTTRIVYILYNTAIHSRSVRVASIAGFTGESYHHDEAEPFLLDTSFIAA